MVDDENQYVADNSPINFTDRVSDYAYAENDKVVIRVSGTVNATKDETYTTGYRTVNATTTTLSAFPEATIKWSSKESGALKESADHTKYILNGETLVGTVTFNSSVNANDGASIEITGTTVTATGLEASDYMTTAGKIEFEAVNLAAGATVTFTFNTVVTNGPVNVTVTASNP